MHILKNAQHAPARRHYFAAAAAFALLSVAGCDGDGGDDDAQPVTPPASTDPRTPLAVTKAADDGTEGTLRWAIERSNTSPGTYRIVLTPPAGGALVIKPAAALPTVVGPARIEGPWAGTGSPAVAVDGLDLYGGKPENCPGTVSGSGANVRSLFGAGLKVAKQTEAKVEFTGFEVRNFCIGILLHQAGSNHIHHMRFVNNLGASGVVITGDDETAAGGRTEGLTANNLVEYNEFLNNSDSMDVARGADNTVIQFNSFKLDSSAVVPSQGVEVLSSNKVKIYDNTFSGYAEALQIGGNEHDIARNTLTGNSIAFTMSGTGNKVYDNKAYGNHAGILTRGGNITLNRNSLYGNGKDISISNAGGIASSNANWLKSRMSLGLNSTSGPTDNDLASACADGFADCDTRQNKPVLGASGWQPAGYFVAGSLATRPNEAFVIEVFASHGAGNDTGDGEVYLGKVEVTSSATGTVAFSYPTGTTDPLKDGTKNVYFTATATRVSSGQTSEFSAPLLISGP